jgi:hypothetical protein
VLLGEVLVLCAIAGEASATASAAPPEMSARVRVTGDASWVTNAAVSRESAGDVPDGGN